MDFAEKRKHVRIDSWNLTHATIGEDDMVFYEGMGRTLNVSESGILLEAPFTAEHGQEIELTIALYSEIIDIKGNVVHCRPGRNAGMNEIGIQFKHVPDYDVRTLKKFIKNFRKYKNQKKDTPGVEDE
jgi:c-di-GMP-binding flagellar brake protein YcgR